MRSLTVALLTISSFICTGYSGCSEKTKPTTPAALAVVANYEVEKLKSDESRYQTARDADDWEKATQVRNESVYRLKRNVDLNYNEFESDLFAHRASQNILFDTAELLGSTAIGVTNGERVKTIIGNVLTGFKGFRKSVDDNFFRNQSMEAIISKMQAGRSRVFTRMAQNLNTLSAQTYSLDEALGDLIEYFYAGSLQKGLQEIAQQAGADAIQAKAEANAVQSVRLASESEFDNAKRIRLRMQELARAVKGSDQQAAADARTVIRSALTAEGITTADNLSDDDLLKALLARSRAILNSPNREAEQRKFMADLKIQ